MPSKASPPAKKAEKKPRKAGKPAAPKTAKAKPTSKVAKIKTSPTAASVDDFLNTVEGERKREDSFSLLKMMKKASGEEPKMWGTSLVGFGNVRLKSPATGREVDWLRIGFAPRKANFSLYLTGDIKKYDALLKKLGNHTTGMGCLYIKKLEDVDTKVLEKLIQTSLKDGFFG